MPFPSDATYFWTFLHFVARFIVGPILCTIEVHNQEHVPRRGGCIVASNHSMGPDYVLLGYAASRQIYYMAKSESFEINPWLTRFLHAVGTFPIQRGHKDRFALQSAVDQIKSGRAVGMFPEGTRSRTGVLGNARSGTTRIAMQTEALVVPAAVMNSHKVLKRFQYKHRPHVIVRFGPPLILKGDLEDPAVIRDNTDRMMYAIAALLPPKYRGPYQVSKNDIDE
ncbi:1-acyl-sn-glycerol-3-phosphate acyltransferase [Chloroflexi bacterium TSY]|nr:1-acyl-sn-glycerol-3-phosphate acyltransferase [Chloroflexi bacterium TSY]